MKRLAKTKPCATCGKDLYTVRPAIKNMKRQKYCDPICFGKSLEREPTTPIRGNYKAQYLYEASECSKCGATKAEKIIHRHHIDENPMNNAPENIEILCVTCHRKTHQKPPITALCSVCGKQFVAKSHRRTAKICSAECVKKWGVISAGKRWSKPSMTV